MEEIEDKSLKGVQGLTDEQAHKYISECLSYDKMTGEFTWRTDRPSTHFKNDGQAKRYNSTQAGKVAGFNNISGYKCVSLNDKQYYLHRIAFLLLKGRWPPEFVDHIDRDPSNNIWTNLREVSHSVNQRNRCLLRANTLT